jgi:hypothetical protein
MKTAKSNLLKDAFRHLDDANERLGLAILYRDYANDGQVERALQVKQRLEAMPSASQRPATRLDELAMRYPHFSRIGNLVALADAKREVA